MFLLLIHFANAATSSPNDTLKFNINQYNIGADIHTGMIINNYVYWDSFPSRNPSLLLEVQIAKQTEGKKEWHQAYNFPEFGLSLIGGYLGNNDELGQTIGLIPHLTLNIKRKKNWRLKLKLGLGFAYFNRPYHISENRTNILIGSHITNLSIAQLYYIRRLNQNLDFDIGISAIHASNGHYQLPNVGGNMATLNVGLKYYFRKEPYPYHPKDKTNISPLKLGLRLSYGIHEFGGTTEPVNQGKYPITDLALYAKKRVGNLGSAMFGLQYKYYNSFYEKIKEHQIFESNIALKASVLTLFLGYEFEMGQFSLLAQGGINVYNPFWKYFIELTGKRRNLETRLKGLISTRLGLQYYLLNKERNKHNIYLGMYIKANMGNADYPCIAIGYVWGKSNLR